MNHYLELKRMFGELIIRANTLALEINIKSDPEIAEKLKKLTEATYEALDYAYLHPKLMTDSRTPVLLSEFVPKFAAAYLKVDDAVSEYERNNKLKHNN